jgi:hypothetical protein
MRQCDVDDGALALRAHLQAALFESLSIALLLAKTSAISSLRPAWRAIDERLRIRAAPIPCLWYSSTMLKAPSALRPNGDIPCGAHDHRLALVVGHRNQGDMIDEVDVEKILGFLFQEMALSDEEAPI